MKCEEKIKFSSKQVAKKSAKRLKRREGTGYAYQCVTCGAYHITKMDPGTYRSIARGEPQIRVAKQSLLDRAVAAGAALMIEELTVPYDPQLADLMRLVEEMIG